MGTKAFFQSYKTCAVHRALHDMVGTFERLRRQNLKGTLWEIKGVTDV